MALETGTRAPAFTTKIQDGTKLSLKDLKGKWVVLYFYPEDDTPTCTKQACDLRDNEKLITGQGAVILGVSPNGVESHRKFIEKFKLPYSLLADENRAICEKYDVWKEKTLYGRKFMGVVRTTYIIDPDGKIAYAQANVRTNGHAGRVADRLRELRAA